MENQYSANRALCPVILTCDGSCKGNPGPGGWAAIVQYGDSEKELSGPILSPCTNNIAELTALLNGLKAIQDECELTVRSDSEYIIKTFIEGRLENWKQRGWKNASNKLIANKELWLQIEAELNRVCPRAKFVYVAGHSGDKMNDRCDTLARKHSGVY